MAETPRAAVEISDFPGLMADVDPHDLPPGASSAQVNVCSLTPGELTVRAGLREISFET